MLFFDKILLPHTFDGIILLILFVLAKHDLSKSSSSQHLQKLKLLKSINVIFIGLALEDDFAFSFNLLILFQTLSIEHQRLDGMYFFDPLGHLVDGIGVGFK